MRLEEKMQSNAQVLQLALIGSNDSLSLEKAEYIDMHIQQWDRCDGGRMGNFSSDCYLKCCNRKQGWYQLREIRKEERWKVSQERRWKIVFSESGGGKGVCTHRTPHSSKAHLRFVVMSLMWGQAAH